MGFFDKRFPEGTTRRKLLQVLSIVFLFEGISVIILYSKAGLLAGLISLVIGLFILLVLPPKASPKKLKDEIPEEKATVKDQPPGIVLVDAVMNWIGNRYVIILIGVVIIALDVVWNLFYSDLPEFGDLDTLSILFGGLLAIYPFTVPKFKVEAAFSLVFLGLVVVFLVVPQAVSALTPGTGSSIGNWYVDNMLAAPFAAILDLIGIPATSTGSMVTITFEDGTIQVLGISAYCAGLYSFSIFLAAFSSFVLVFERLKPKLLVFVLAVGLVVAFLGNLFRMVIIGVIGYYYGINALLWAHENIGWIIFLSWSAVFWYILLGYVSKHSSRPGLGQGEKTSKQDS